MAFAEMFAEMVTPEFWRLGKRETGREMELCGC
jgi:hypothetical protein